MAEIRWTDEAAAWLDDIHKYIAKESPGGAAKVARGIYEKVHPAKEYPVGNARYNSPLTG